MEEIDSNTIHRFEPTEYVDVKPGATYPRRIASSRGSHVDAMAEIELLFINFLG